MPEHHIIEYAKKQNYELFYDSEIEIRKRLNYPPFCDIIMLKLTSESDKEIEQAAIFLYQAMQKVFKENEIMVLMYKPVPSPINKIKNKYRWRIVLKCKLNRKIIRSLNEVLELSQNKKYKKTSIIVDINPNNMM